MVRKGGRLVARPRGFGPCPRRKRRRRRLTLICTAAHEPRSQPISTRPDVQLLYSSSSSSWQLLHVKLLPPSPTSVGVRHPSTADPRWPSIPSLAGIARTSSATATPSVNLSSLRTMLQLQAPRTAPLLLPPANASSYPSRQRSRRPYESRPKSGSQTSVHGSPGFTSRSSLAPSPSPFSTRLASSHIIIRERRENQKPLKRVDD